jgi:hypothetical protein
MTTAFRAAPATCVGCRPGEVSGRRPTTARPQADPGEVVVQLALVGPAAVAAVQDPGQRRVGRGVAGALGVAVRRTPWPRPARRALLPLAGLARGRARRWFGRPWPAADRAWPERAEAWFAELREPIGTP